MNPLPFILGAYVLALLGTAGLGIASLVAMRRSERDAENLRREP